jgi:hypothetical protein
VPQIGGIGVARATIFDELFCVGFGESFDLSQPEPQHAPRGGSVVRPSRRALRALLRMRENFDAIHKSLLILRRLRSSRLEGRTARNAAV